MYNDVYNRIATFCECRHVEWSIAAAALKHLNNKARHTNHQTYSSKKHVVFAVHFPVVVVVVGCWLSVVGCWLLVVGCL